MKRIIMVTGGARSGKSSYALQAAMRYGSRALIATAIPFDGEMAERIGKHQAERNGAFLTVEEATDLARALNSLPGNTGVAVIDCLTVWLGNLMHCYGAKSEVFPEVESFLKALNKPPCDLIIVTNEVGMGVVPHNAMARSFRDMAGRVNKDIARIADEVVLMVSGIPIVIKK